MAAAGSWMTQLISLCTKLDGALTQRFKQMIYSGGEMCRLKLILVLLFGKLSDIKMASGLQIIKKETKPELVRSVVFHRALGAMEPERRGVFIPANWLTDLVMVY